MVDKKQRSEYNKKYRLLNIDKIKISHRNDYLKNKAKYLKYSKDYHAKKRLEDPERVRHFALIRLKKYQKTAKGVYKVISRRFKNYKDNLSQKDFIDWYKAQEKRCYYCGLPEEKLFLVKNEKGKARFSIDRMDNSKGYEKGNICLACYTCNRVKGEIFDSITMKKIAKIFIKPLWLI
jgi:hypothetical protein